MFNQTLFNQQQDAITTSQEVAARLRNKVERIVYLASAQWVISNNLNAIAKAEKAGIAAENLLGTLHLKYETVWDREFIAHDFFHVYEGVGVSVEDEAYIEELQRKVQRGESTVSSETVNRFLRKTMYEGEIGRLVSDAEYLFVVEGIIPDDED